MNWFTYNSQVSPVQQIAQSLGTITLDDTLTTAHFGEIEHIGGQLIDTIIQTNVSSINDVDAIRFWISDMLLHEATETR